MKFCYRLDRLSLSLSLSLGSKPLSLSLLSQGSKTSEPRAWAWGSKNSLSWALSLSLWTSLNICFTWNVRTNWLLQIYIRTLDLYNYYSHMVFEIHWIYLSKVTIYSSSFLSHVQINPKNSIRRVGQVPWFPWF